MAENTNTCIYVGNLPFNFDEQQLCNLFSHCGPIQHATINKMSTPDGLVVSRGFGFVTFQSPESAQKAFHLSADSLDGIKVDWGNKQGKSNQAGWPKSMPIASIIPPIVNSIATQNIVIGTQQNLHDLQPNSNLITIVPSSSGKAIVNNVPVDAEARDHQLKLIEAQTIWNNFSIFISGFPSETAKTDLLHYHFSKCGPILKICIIKNEASSLDIAKITFRDKRAAAMAILDFDGTEWMGGKLRCEWCTRAKSIEYGFNFKQTDNENTPSTSTPNIPLLLPANPIATTIPTDIPIIDLTMEEDSEADVNDVVSVDSEKPPGVDTSDDEEVDNRRTSTKQTMANNAFKTMEVEKRDIANAFKKIQTKDSISVSRHSSSGLWLPKSRKWIASPPPPFGKESWESDKPSEASVLAERLRNNPDILPRERIKLVMDFLTKE